MMNDDLIDYEIIDGLCSYCGRVADWCPISDLDGFFRCVPCDAYNADLEMNVDDSIIIFPTDDDNINVYF